MAVGEERFSITRPVIERVCRHRRFHRCFYAGLAGLGLHHIGDVVGIVDDPVLELQQPFLAALGAQGFPFGLEQPQFARLGGDGLGRIVGYFADQTAIGGIAHLDGGLSGSWLGRGHASPRSTAQLDVRCGVRIPSTGLPDANIRVAASADPRLR